MNKVFLLLGSNLGDRKATISEAIRSLQSAGNVSGSSSLYQTAAWGKKDQPDFLNMAVAVSAPDIDPFSLLKICLEIETRLGRARLIPKGARTIDIDLLIIGDLIIDEVRGGVALTLPHPRLNLRRFALTPLAEIAPELPHPILGRTMEQLLVNVNDPASVRIYAG